DSYLDWSIFVSTDQGETFNAVTEFTGADLSGFISGIATHPYEDSTAYILFSFSGEPKILRTKDLGQTWEDISGFNGNSTSSNGFPDFVTHSLVVLPNDPNTIWVGTDIGLYESNDDGISWHYVENDLPAVSIWDMFVQDGQVVVATHGRGIWTADIEELTFIPELNGEYSGKQTISAIYNLMSGVDSIELYLDDEYKSTVPNVQSGTDTIKTIVTAEGEYSIQLISYVNNNPYYSYFTDVVVDFSPVITDLSKGTEDLTVDITAYVNENYDSLQIILNDAYSKSITDFELGENVFSIEYNTTRSQVISIIGYISGVGYESAEEDIYLTYVGISDLFKVNSLKVYPNPTNGYVNVELPENFNENYTIDVYSLSGAKVFSTRINKSDSRFNLENLKDGLYIIKLEHDGEIYSQKIQIKK
ncbi:MAG: T9SS type A sorting domain-containing protein, partial [Bacteroidales bacterium]|nr:T9SS type A sorting domain-containing protein [Bacteroidales bacterium]